MIRILIAASAVFLTTLLSGAAFACSLAPTGWSLAQGEYLAAPDGPFVLTLENYYGFEEDVPFVGMTVIDSDGNTIDGSAEIVRAGSDDRPSIVWTPEQPLADGDPYFATIDFDQENFGAMTEVSLIARSDALNIDLSVERASAEEFPVTATQECCSSDDMCMFDSGCGGESSSGRCEACWTTSWDYRVRPHISVDTGSSPTGRYLLRLDYLAANGERVVLDERVLLASGQMLTVGGDSLEAYVELPICLELTSTDVVTGESAIVAEECLEETDIQRDGRDHQPEEAPDFCDPGTFTSIDENGTQVPIADPAKATDDGCSAAGTGAASWLMLLVAGLARRRRRR
jgi:uncharacterized protein (TIGR03382 family)